MADLVHLRSAAGRCLMQQYPEFARLRSAKMSRNALLACGILSSLVYVLADILGALSWDGYQYASQAVSELSAIGAPSRPYVLPAFLAYDLLMIAFGFGVRASAGRRRALRVTGACLIAIGAIGLAAFFFPMQLRGTERALTDTMHIVLTTLTALAILVAVGSSVGAFGNGFRLYAIATILVLLLFGVTAELDAPRIDANLATPYLGITERINIGAYLLWVAVLAIALLRTGLGESRPSAFKSIRT